MLSHKDLNDFEINDDFKNKKKDYVGMNNPFDYISQYSKIWKRQRKIDDMKKILKTTSHSLEKITCFETKSSKKINLSSDSHNPDNSENNYDINTFNKDTQNLIKGISNFKFNIFELNSFCFCPENK